MVRDLHPAQPGCATCAWPEAWRSTAWPTAGSCARTVRGAVGTAGPRRRGGGAPAPALFAYNAVLGKPRGVPDDHCYWGPDSDSDPELPRQNAALPTRRSPRAMIRETARLLRRGPVPVVGWFQGRMEWGPRSLAAAHPRDRGTRRTQRVNLKIKFARAPPISHRPASREGRRRFEIDCEKPYMLWCAR